MPPSLQASSTGAGEAINVNFTPFFAVGALAVVIWDMLSEIRGDNYLFSSKLLQRVGMKRFAYFLARLSVLSYLMTDAIFQIIPQPATACGQIQTVQAILFVVATAFTHLLVFLRILCAFQYDRYTGWLFGLLWALVVAGSTTIIYGTSLVAPGSPVTACNLLINQRIEPYVAAAMLGPMLYLCLAYMFISGRLVVDVRMDLSMEHGMKELLMGMFVPIFGKGLLGEGQAFYLEGDAD
uniref:Uncharacterized protein n=1 Tax=Psilocybe cubensis TaxID=181762 RepID=A0A8H8CFZ8_PSICU